MEESFLYYIEHSIKTHWNHQALSDYKGATHTYKDVARKIAKLHLLFENGGIKKGDKIALCSRNMSNWGIAFLATLSYGAVAIPILRIQTRQHSPYYQPFGCAPSFRRRIRMGRHRQRAHAQTGRHL